MPRLYRIIERLWCFSGLVLWGTQDGKGFPPMYQSVRDDEHLWADDDDEDVIYPEVGNS